MYPELSGVIFLLISVRKPKEKGGGKTLSFLATCYVVSLLARTKRNEKISRGKDPELSGVISLLFSIRNAKDKGRGVDRELSGVISVLFLIKKAKEKSWRGDPELSGVISLLF